MRLPRPTRTTLAPSGACPGACVRFSRPALGFLTPLPPAGVSGRRRRPAPPGFLLGAPETPPLGRALLPLGQLRFSTEDSAQDPGGGPRSAGGAAPPKVSAGDADSHALVGNCGPSFLFRARMRAGRVGLRLSHSAPPPRSIPAAKPPPERGPRPIPPSLAPWSPSQALQSPRPAEPVLMLPSGHWLLVPNVQGAVTKLYVGGYFR